MTSQVVVSEEQEKRALVQRIADSPGFRSAPRLRDFLLFVTDLALSGRTSEISEQHIGHAVFRRSVDYETATDNIVRVSARQLRTKLKEYAEHDGELDAWLLDIPKGAYVPVFTRRPVQLEPLPIPSTDPATVSTDAVRPWKITAGVCALVAVLAVAALLYDRATNPRRNSGESPLTDLIIRPGQRTLVILADSSMVLLHELTGHITTADDYATRQMPPPPKDPSMQNFTRSIATQQLTSIADVGFALRLFRLRPDAADRLNVIHARNVGPRSLKEGNIILLGGPRSNPWTKLFEERLNYRFDFSGDRSAARLVNTHAQTGEPPFYETDRRNNSVVRAYARIALVPNLDNTGSVLLISGTAIEATEAGTEFFVGARSADTLAQALGRAPTPGNSFEVLLETTAIDGTARSSRIVSARFLQ